MTKYRYNIGGGAAVRLPLCRLHRWPDERHSESVGNRATVD